MARRPQQSPSTGNVEEQLDQDSPDGDGIVSGSAMEKKVSDLTESLVQPGGSTSTDRQPALDEERAKLFGQSILPVSASDFTPKQQFLDGSTTARDDGGDARYRSTMEMETETWPRVDAGSGDDGAATGDHLEVDMVRETSSEVSVSPVDILDQIFLDSASAGIEFDYSYFMDGSTNDHVSAPTGGNFAAEVGASSQADVAGDDSVATGYHFVADASSKGDAGTGRGDAEQEVGNKGVVDEEGEDEETCLARVRDFFHDIAMSG